MWEAADIDYYTVRDVTKQHEEMQRKKACFRALNAASDRIFIIDANRKITFCNDMFLKTFHIYNHEDIIGLYIYEVIPDMLCNSDVWSHVQTNQTWEGSFREYIMTIVPVMNGVPKPIYYVCTMKHKKQETTHGDGQ